MSLNPDCRRILSLPATVCVPLKSAMEPEHGRSCCDGREAKVATLVIKCTIIRFYFKSRLPASSLREGEVQQLHVADSSSSALIANELETNSILTIISIVANEIRACCGQEISMRCVFALIISTLASRSRPLLAVHHKLCFS